MVVQGKVLFSFVVTTISQSDLDLPESVFLSLDRVADLDCIPILKEVFVKHLVSLVLVGCIAANLQAVSAQVVIDRCLKIVNILVGVDSQLAILT